VLLIASDEWVHGQGQGNMVQFSRRFVTKIIDRPKSQKRQIILGHIGVFKSTA
jgi:hypothetical protein